MEEECFICPGTLCHSVTTAAGYVLLMTAGVMILDAWSVLTVCSCGDHVRSEFYIHSSSVQISFLCWTLNEAFN